MAIIHGCANNGPIKIIRCITVSFMEVGWLRLNYTSLGVYTVLKFGAYKSTNLSGMIGFAVYEPLAHVTLSEAIYKRSI
jgi:hypothetical protein